MQLSYTQKTDCLAHMPSFELSYETISHKKVSTDYDITMAIPYGKKVILWFTYYKDRNVCLCMDLDKDKKIGAVRILIDNDIPVKLAYGTMLYGCICEISDKRDMFIIEDILICFGLLIYRQHFQEKLAFINLLFTQHSNIFGKETVLPIMLPVCWNIEPGTVDTNKIPEKYKNDIPYSIHHIQHRPLHKIAPFINVPQSRNIMTNISKTQTIPDTMLFIPPSLPQFHTNKPQYKRATVFEMKADIQNDIYHIYAFGSKSSRVYCGITYIPNCKVSAMMNGIFRKIKENECLDALEESDDEEEFQDTCADKYVDLQKVQTIECSYLVKFKRWMPVRIAHNKQHIVHMCKL